MDNRSFAIDPPKNEFGQDYRKKYDQSSVNSSEKSGHNRAECVVTIQRNRWSVWSGMSGHFAAEFALDKVFHEKAKISIPFRRRFVWCIGSSQSPFNARIFVVYGLFASTAFAFDGGHYRK